jgi:bifunctional DNA primase/polymerase-like protein/AAA domain-containing protein
MAPENPLLRAALCYAARGWKVFPLRPGGKVPLTRHGFRDATTDPAALRHWWCRHERANIGVATGAASGLWVLDVDRHDVDGDGADGVAALAALERLKGALPQTLLQQTPSGGHHRFFRVASGLDIRNSAGRVAPGIDVRGEGGYVAVAPSLDPAGTPYRWAERTDPAAAALAAAPDWLLALARRQARDKASHGDPYVEAAFARILAALSRAREGGRNDALNRAAFATGQLVATGSLERNRCIAALHGAALSLGLSPDEVARTVESGLAAGIASPRALQETGPLRIARKPPERVEKPPLALIWFADIAAALEPADFVERLLTDGGLSVIYGEPGCGKTFLVLDLALHVALGRPWLGRAVAPGGVVYVALEGTRGLANRIEAFRRRHALGNADLPFAMISGAVDLRDPRADTPRLIAAVGDAARRINGRVRLIVVDTLSRALAGGNENASEDMGALVMNASAVSQATGAHLAFVHHSGKDRTRGARGHNLLLGAVDTEIEVTRTAESGIATATVTKQKDLERDAPFSFRLESETLGRDAAGRAITSCVVVASAAPAPVPEPQAAAPALSDAEHRALREIGALIARAGIAFMVPEAGTDPVVAVTRRQLRQWFVARGLIVADAAGHLDATNRTRLHRLVTGLVERGRIRVRGDHVWLA